MAWKRKELATQQTLRRNPTFLHKANSQGSQELEQQEVAKIPVCGNNRALAVWNTTPIWVYMYKCI